MTAPDARQSDELREAIARALHSVGYRGTDSAVAALLPVVTAYAERRALEAWNRAQAERAAAVTADTQPVQP